MPAAKPSLAGVRRARAPPGRRGAAQSPSPSRPPPCALGSSGAGSSSACGEGAVQRVTEAASLARLATRAAAHAPRAKQAQAPQPLPRSLCPAFGSHTAAPCCGTCCDRYEISPLLRQSYPRSPLQTVDTPSYRCQQLRGWGGGSV